MNFSAEAGTSASSEEEEETTNRGNLEARRDASETHSYKKEEFTASAAILRRGYAAISDQQQAETEPP